MFAGHNIASSILLALDNAWHRSTYVPLSRSQTLSLPIKWSQSSVCRARESFPVFNISGIDARWSTVTPQFFLQLGSSFAPQSRLIIEIGFLSTFQFCFSYWLKLRWPSDFVFWSLVHKWRCQTPSILCKPYCTKPKIGASEFCKLWYTFAYV